MSSLVLGMLSIYSAQAQVSEQFEELRNYVKLQPAIGGSLYAAAISTSASGDMEMQNLPNWGLNLGFEYDFRPTKKWSLVMGVFLYRQPAMHNRFDFNSEMLPNVESDFSTRVRSADLPALSIPICISSKHAIDINRFMEFRAGMVLRNLPYSGFVFDFYASSPDANQNPVFVLSADSPSNHWHPGLTASGGLTKVNDGMMLKLILSFNYFFQDVLAGEYQFVNLQNTADSRGTYRFRGNNLTITCVFSWQKRKYRNHQIEP